MNKYGWLLFLFLLTSAGSFAQNQDTAAFQPDSLQADSTLQILSFDLNPSQGFNFWEERFKGNWAGVFLAVNDFDRADYSMYNGSEDGFLETSLWKSNSLSINPIQVSMRLQRNRNFIGLVTGLGLDLQSYRLDAATSIRKGEQGIEPVHLSYEDNQKSKFSSTYLTLPLLLEFQIPMGNYNRRLYFSGGVIGSLRLASHTKVKYRIDGKRQKLKTPGDFYLRDTRLSGTIRMGYRWINLFATYDFYPLFKDDRGPVLYPFSVGVGLVKF
ncbi:MAG: outer membrane beta-barrel protein [Mangrovibacterium sp.]